MTPDAATLADLVSSKVIADRLGVSRTAVGMWRSRDVGFPAPLDVPGVSVPLFSWAEVAAWNAHHRVRALLAEEAAAAEAKPSTDDGWVRHRGGGRG